MSKYDPLIIQAYKCPIDGQVFETPEEYSLHIKNIQKLEKKLDRKNKKEQEKIEFIRNLREAPSLNALIDFIKTNEKKMFRLFLGVEREFTKITVKPNYNSNVFGMSWSQNISNSHSSPIGEPQNFRRESNLPTSFPGWQGTIEFSVNKPTPHFLTDIFKHTPLNTGSGGGSTYELKLYAQDFKKMAVNSFITDFNEVKEQKKFFPSLDRTFGERLLYLINNLTDEVLQKEKEITQVIEEFGNLGQQKIATEASAALLLKKFQPELTHTEKIGAKKIKI